MSLLRSKSLGQCPRRMTGALILVFSFTLPFGTAEEPTPDQTMKEIEQLLEDVKELQRATEGERNATHKRAKRKDGGEHRDELEQILEGLEYGIIALDRLGKRDALEMLQRIANEVREERAGRKKKDRGGRESKQKDARRHLEVMHWAVEILSKLDRGDAAEIIEHSMHAIELRLEGRKDKEAMHIYETAPDNEVVAPLLAHAAHFLAEHGQADKAELVRNLATSMSGKKKEEHGKKKEERGQREHQKNEGSNRERQQLERHTEIMRLGIPALLEAGHKNDAAQLELAIHVRKLALEGKRDEARKMRKKSPDGRQLARILGLSARLWDEYGHETKAGELRELAQLFKQQSKREHGEDAGERDALEERKRAELQRLHAEQARAKEKKAQAEAEKRSRMGDHGKDPGADLGQRVKRLETHIKELEKGMKRAMKELEDLKRGLR